MSTKYAVWFKDYANNCWMLLSWAPTFSSIAEGEAWLDGDHDWDMPVRLDEVSLCEDCDKPIGNSVFEEVHGYTLCHNCITDKPKPRPVPMHAIGCDD
jgi:hypothetical protein